MIKNTEDTANIYHQLLSLILKSNSGKITITGYYQTLCEAVGLSAYPKSGVFNTIKSADVSAFIEKLNIAFFTLLGNVDDAFLGKSTIENLFKEMVQIQKDLKAMEPSVSMKG